MIETESSREAQRFKITDFLRRYAVSDELPMNAVENMDGRITFYVAAPSYEKVTVDLSACQESFFAVAMARQAFLKGLKLGRESKVREVRKVLELEN